MENKQLLQSIRGWVIFFMLGLVVSGGTAFMVETGMEMIVRIWPGPWMVRVYGALVEMNARYPFLAYGYDWLAFGHLVIALAFVGVLRDPVRNVWVIEWAMLACVAVFPLAWIAGAVRGIPYWWRVVDCLFGVVGFGPLLICLRKIRRLERNTLNCLNE